MTGQQPALFPADQLAPKPCPVPGCQAIRYPDAKQVPTCAHDLQTEPARRPRGCLNTYQPEHAEIPY